MKSMGHPIFKISPPPFQESVSRPRTAQACSYKKLTEILQGKYISLQNKFINKLDTKTTEDRKRQTVIIQNNKKNSRKSSRNTSMQQSRKTIKQNNQFENLLDLQKLRSIQPNYSLKQSNKKLFVPYALQQQKYKTVWEQQVIVPQRSSKIKRINANNKQKIEKNGQQSQINSWKNIDEEDLTFSSLFKNSWKI